MSMTNTSADARLPVRKGVLTTMLPRSMSWTDRCKLARAVGFEELESPTVTDPGEAEQLKEAAAAAGMKIHSVMNAAHWKFPLSSGDPAVVAESMKGLETSLRNAKLWRADAVLLVPAVVDAKTSYRDAWTRSRQQIRRILPMAAEFKVAIAVENVGNRFLLSPIEFGRYIDEFENPWVRAYFDVGNILRIGFPQDWIRTLGKRIVKIHLKDRKANPASTESPKLLEGDVDWQEVRQALVETGFRGSATVELPGGDEAYLRDVSRRVDVILGRAQA